MTEGKRGDLLFREDYQTSFSSRQYLEDYYSTEEGACDENDCSTFVTNATKQFFSKIAGERLLEIGSGPSIQFSIVGSRNFKEITLSDFSPENLQEIEKWLDGAEDAFNWSWMIDFYAKNENVETSEIIQRVRQRVRRPLLECDVLRSPMIDQSIGKFDAVVSCLCLEAACETVEQFKGAVKQLGDMLLPSGHLVLVTVLGQTFYSVGKCRFYCCKLTEDDLDEALTQAGFEVVEKLQVSEKRQNKVSSDFTGVSVCLAKKLAF